MLLDGQVLEEVRLVGHEGERGLGRHRVGGQIVTGHPDPSPARHGDPGQALEGGGLAGAVGADQPEDLPGPDLERQVLDRGELAVHLVEAFDLDH